MMNKVICDICGTDYPETASQCPICGCAKANGAQTAAGNATKEESGYTYVRGGRFSKANVRKRLKASQIQQAAAMESKQLEAIASSDDDDFDEDELDNVSNKGLIVIVILLLLAIIAVGSYIAVSFLGGRGENPSGQGQQATAPQASNTQPTQPQATPIPCTKLTLHDSEIILENSDAPFFELYWQVEPENTTDLIEFTSADPSVATVDANGVVTAVGNGETVITVKCGTFEAKCDVVCKLDGDEPDVSDPTDPSDGPDVPDVPDEPVTLTLDKKDFTLFSKGDSWQIKVTTEGLDSELITWSSDDETVAKVENGKVVAVGVGRTTIRATYDGQEAICKVSCRWEETTEPTDPPVEDNNPPAPPVDDEQATHELLVNGAAPSYRYEDKENSADLSLAAGDDANLSQCIIKITNAENVVWSNSNEAACSVDENGKVTALSGGQAILTAEVDGITFTVMIRVS